MRGILTRMPARLKQSQLAIVPGENSIAPTDLPGCISTDPLLAVPAPGGGFHLLAGSPCADAGDNFAAPGILTDLDGNPRFVDDPGAPDTGNGTAPLIDMDAYER